MDEGFVIYVHEVDGEIRGSKIDPKKKDNSYSQYKMDVISPNRQIKKKKKKYLKLAIPVKEMFSRYLVFAVKDL